MAPKRSSSPSPSLSFSLVLCLCRFSLCRLIAYGPFLSGLVCPSPSPALALSIALRSGRCCSSLRALTSAPQGPLLPDTHLLFTVGHCERSIEAREKTREENRDVRRVREETVRSFPHAAHFRLKRERCARGCEVVDEACVCMCIYACVRVCFVCLCVCVWQKRERERGEREKRPPPSLPSPPHHPLLRLFRLRTL